MRDDVAAADPAALETAVEAAVAMLGEGAGGGDGSERGCKTEPDEMAGHGGLLRVQRHEDVSSSCAPF